MSPNGESSSESGFGGGESCAPLSPSAPSSRRSRSSRSSCSSLFVLLYVRHRWLLRFRTGVMMAHRTDCLSWQPSRSRAPPRSSWATTPRGGPRSASRQRGRVLGRRGTDHLGGRSTGAALAAGCAACGPTARRAAADRRRRCSGQPRTRSIQWCAGGRPRRRADGRRRAHVGRARGGRTPAPPHPAAARVARGPGLPPGGDARPRGRRGGRQAPRRWGLVVVVADLDAAVEATGDRSAPRKDAVQPGRRIATVRPEAGLSVPLALMTPRG